MGRLSVLFVLVAFACCGLAEPGAAGSKPPVVSITSISAQVVQAPSGRELRVRWASTGAGREGFLVTLWRGRELWLAESASQSPAVVGIPEGLAGGRYEVRVHPHAARCARCPSGSVRIDGPTKAGAQALGYGTYVDRDGTPHRWFINRAGTLIWDGKPYVPAGAMYLSNFLMSYRPDNPVRNEDTFRDDIKRLSEMKKAGINDIYLNPCVKWRERPAWVWQRFVDLCEEMGFRYGIQVTQETKKLRFWEIDSSLYTASIKGGETARIEVKSDLLTSIGPSNAALYAAFNTQTGEPVDGGRARVVAAENGVSIEATPKADPGRALTVHFVPERNYDGGLHDYWTCVNDEFKKEMNSFFSDLKLGPGLRLWIDPLDNEQGLGGYAANALPNSAGFRPMFADWLKRKYGGVGRLGEAWGIRAGDYGVFARLVPCGAASDGAKSGFAIDQQTGRIYKFTSARSAMWSDIRYFRENSVAEFNIRIADMIKRHHDVPVVLKHEGTDMYTNCRTHGGFDGLGAEAYGQDVEHLRDCSRAVHAQALQCGRTMWELTTETGLVWSAPGYPDPPRMFSELASMVQMGAKGTYCFLIMVPSGHPNGDWYQFNLAEDPRQYWWLGAYAKALKQSKALPDYRPESMASTPQAEFHRKALGTEALDLGWAFQGLRIGSTAYVWNLRDVDLALRFRGSQGDRTAVVKPGAREPVIVEGLARNGISGADEANLRAVALEWERVAARAREIGFPVASAPSSRDWRAVLSEAQKMRKANGDVAATRMGRVEVDGDLGEWAGATAIHPKLNNDIAGSVYDMATFYLGWDEERLYVVGKVTDDIVANNNPPGKIWNGDAAEVFIDLDPDTNPDVNAYSPDCFQFIFSPTSAGGSPAMAVFSPSLPPDSAPKHTRLAAKHSPDGWTFEAAIGREDLRGFELKPGVGIGFDVQLDNSDGGDRVWSKLWHGTEQNFNERLGFGRLVLGFPK